MSTLSSQLLVASSSFAEDIYKGVFRKEKASQRELIWGGRATVLIISLVALFFAFRKNDTILNLIGYVWSGFGAAFGPAVLHSLFWKRTTRNGVIAGIVTGGLTVILWQYTGSKLFDVIPGFILSSIAIPVVSLLGKPPSQQIQDEFDEMRSQVKRRK